MPLAVTAVLGLGLTACGGGGELSKKDLAKKANAICVKADNQGKAIATPANIQDAAQAAKYFDKAAPIVDKATKDLKALKPAKAVKADWNDFLAKQERANDLLAKVRRKADAKDASGLQDLQNFSGLATDRAAAAKRVGATGCA